MISIFSRTSFVNFCSASAASKFSSNCSRRVAPVMTAETSFLLITRRLPIARWLSLIHLLKQSIDLTFSIFSSVIRSRIQFIFSREARDPSGMPSLYFPVRIPKYKGDQVVRPMPNSLQTGVKFFFHSFAWNIVILRLFHDRRNEIELPCDTIWPA